MSLKSQESCIINGGQTTNYFKLKRGTRQGDTLSAYLFIFVLEKAFIKTKQNPSIKSLNVCINDFLYTVYADDTTFLLQNEKAATEVLNNFNIMSQFSGLKINKSKCEVAGIGVMKGVKVALCGVQCVNLLTNTIKILGIYFSYNKKLENEKNFLDHIANLQKVINIWEMRNLSLLGKIIIFKTLALSKIIHLALITNVPTATIELLNKIQKDFLWGKTSLRLTLRPL